MNGPEIRAIREAAGVSQERLASLMGVGRSYVSQIENRARITDRLRVRYMAALDAAQRRVA